MRRLPVFFIIVMCVLLAQSDYVLAGGFAGSSSGGIAGSSSPSKTKSNTGSPNIQKSNNDSPSNTQKSKPDDGYIRIGQIKFHRSEIGPCYISDFRETCPKCGSKNLYVAYDYTQFMERFVIGWACKDCKYHFLRRVPGPYSNMR